MPNINIQVAAKIATNLSPGTSIVCGNSDYTLTFNFDAEWSAHAIKTARFVYTLDGQVKYKEVAFSGNVVAVPVLSNIAAVYVGVYAGELHTTTPARVICDRSILCGTGTEHEEPDPDVYNQILEAVNQLIGEVGNHPARTDNPHGVTAAQVGAAPASHAADKNNPHGVTAEQVGAAPASHATDKNNPHGVTAEQVGAAPAGYGLGEEGQHMPITDVAQIDNIKANGWYAVTQTIGSPLSLNSVLFNILNLEVSMLLSDYGKQIVTFTDGLSIRRTMDAGAWQPWEWENPPLVLWQEYRTTERYLGKAVYQKVFDFGALPAAKAETRNHNCGLTALIDYSIIGSNDNTNLTQFPGIASVYNNGGQMTITTSSDLSHLNAYVWLKYTKD